MMKVLDAAEIAIDFPQEGESVTHPQYAFRIGACDAEQVHISINRTQWQPCRLSAGFWWFDWSNYRPGRHEAQVKAVTSEGDTRVSEPRSFKVDL